MTKEQIQRNFELADVLESGQYTQGRRRLKVGDTYCCLGVACDLYHKNTGRGRWTSEDDFAVKDDVLGGLPVLAVAKYYGWVGFNPVITIQGISESASHMNDYGASFIEIAEGFRDLARASK